MKYVYLYKITLKKKRKKPLYYFGIRSCECLPEDDPYMGSPTTYADLWKDESYVKTKEILKFGEYETWFEKFRDEEVELIKEGWNQFGLYGKDKKGSCLNVCAGRSVIFTPEVRARHKEIINRPEVKAKISGENNIMKRPEVKAKISGENNIMKRPEVRARQKEAMNKPEVKAKRSKIMKEIMNKPDVKARHKEALNKPELRAKRSKIMKELMNRPEVRAKFSGENNPMKRPEVKARQKEAMNKPEVKAKFCGDNSPMKRPEVKDKRRETLNRNRLLRKLQNATGSLEPFFT